MPSFSLITPENYAFVARNLLAGYVFIICRSYYFLGSKPKLAELLVHAVILSLINQLVFTWIAGILAYVPFWTSASNNIKLITEVLILPVCLGLLMGWLLSRERAAWIFRLCAIPVIHPIERAYDYAFAQQRAPGFVIVTYEDGTVVRGYLVSSDPDRSDLYLERLYSGGENVQWTSPQPGRSGYISLKGVRSIEFLDPQD
jgi:hypothetical protein